MSLNGLFLSFSALCDFLKKYIFEKKIQKFFFEKTFSKFFQKLFFEYFWALDIAPTWDDPVLFFFRLQSSHWSVHFSYNSYNLKILQFLLSNFK